MSASNPPKLSLKVAIDKKKSKVLFAEAGSDFVDILLSFLTLPLRKIIYILENHYGSEAPVVGSITSLYRTISSLDGSLFCGEGAKEILLNPRSWWEAEWCKLKLDITDSHSAKYFVCAKCSRSKCVIPFISMYSNVVHCNICCMLMNNQVCSGDRPVPFYGGVFIIKESSFVISDDLHVVPAISKFVETINTLGITDADEADFTILSFGIDDIMELLKLSLTSSTPLSDLIIKDRQRQRYPTSASLFHRAVMENDEALNSRKMILNATIQKSTNKYLFGQIKDDFVEFLFSFLTSSMARIEHLLSGKTHLQIIDNVYRSVKDSIGSDYFMSSDIRNRLINPELARGCVPEIQILPLGEDLPPMHYYYRAMSKHFSCREGPSMYVKKKTMYIVSDDLTLSPYSISSSMSILSGLGIPLSDVREMELHIGPQEALRILKASLTSKTVITDALLFNKASKQES